MSHLNVYIMNKVRKLLLVCGCFLGSMSLSAEVTSGSDFEILIVLLSGGSLYRC